MRFNCAPGARVGDLAHYDMDHQAQSGRGVPRQSRGDIFDLMRKSALGTQSVCRFW